MRTETPQPIRLSDYRPPAFLVDEIHLDFDLRPSATRVRARLSLRRNGAAGEPLLLEGERLTPISIAIDGRALGEGAVVHWAWLFEAHRLDASLTHALT